METDGSGAGLGLRECLPLFLSHTKTIDFFSFPALSEERRKISFQRPPHGQDTWTRDSQVPSGGVLSPGGNQADSCRPPCCSFSTPFSTPRSSSDGSEPSAVPPANKQQALPSHEASAQAQKLFLRKQGSGSQRRKPDFGSKYKPPQESSEPAELLSSSAGGAEPPYLPSNPNTGLLLLFQSGHHFHVPNCLF